MKIDNSYTRLSKSYIFSEVEKKTKERIRQGAKLYKLGVGDLTLPIPKCIISAMVKATKELGDERTFKGYGEEVGYPFLRSAVSRYYSSLGVTISGDEVFIGDGANSDLVAVSDLFDSRSTALIFNPTYPAYKDIALLKGFKVKFISANRHNGFLPLPDKTHKADIIYLCTPSNPAGVHYTKKGLQNWVDFAKSYGSVIIYDSAYSCFVRDGVKSIYQIEGAKDCAIEINSLSKWAGFTGVRCSFTVVPKNLNRLNEIYYRHRLCKFNGVSYITQRGAEAVFTANGMREVDKNIDYYIQNTQIIKGQIATKNIYFVAGAPYIFMETPKGVSSQSFFDKMLSLGVVITPGIGFGSGGEGYIRLSAFAKREDILGGLPLIIKQYE